MLFYLFLTLLLDTGLKSFYSAVQWTFCSDGQDLFCTVHIHGYWALEMWLVWIFHFIALTTLNLKLPHMASGYHNGLCRLESLWSIKPYCYKVTFLSSKAFLLKVWSYLVLIVYQVSLVSIFLVYLFFCPFTFFFLFIILLSLFYCKIWLT